MVPADDIAAVGEETERQLTAFRSLVGRDPTHIDSHQHVHRSEPVRSVLIEAARRLAIPLRHESPGIHHRGDFYGQTAKGLPLPDAISVEALIGALATLPPGVTELGCHPGFGDDLDSAYRSERADEVRALCDPRVRAAIVSEGIVLCSFGELGGDRLGPAPG